MDKEKVLSAALANYPNKNNNLMSASAGDMMMVIFHLGRMKDAGGFDELETHKLTGSGFDLASDIYELGWRVDLETIFEMLNEIFEDQDNKMLATLIFATQRMSIAEMKEMGNG
jgi:hypothetical protein